MNAAGSDPLLLARCHIAMADIVPEGAEESLAHAQAAVQLLEQVTGPPSALLSTALKLIAITSYGSVTGCRSRTSSEPRTSIPLPTRSR